MNNEAFFEKWKFSLDNVSHILDYLHTYPSVLKSLEIDNMITSEELIHHQSKWIDLYSKYRGQEKAFFKSFWVPLKRDSYDCFLDLSIEKYPIIETSFFSFEPYGYSKIILFDSVSDLMLLNSAELNIELIKKERLSRLKSQRNKKFKERNNLAYKGEIKIDKPLFSEILQENCNALDLRLPNPTKIVCKNVTSLVVGIFPFDLEVVVQYLEMNLYTTKDEMLDYDRIRNIRDLTYYIRSKGFLRVERYSLKINSNDALIIFENGRFEVISNPFLIKVFTSELRTIIH